MFLYYVLLFFAIELSVLSLFSQFTTNNSCLYLRSTLACNQMLYFIKETFLSLKSRWSAVKKNPKTIILKCFANITKLTLRLEINAPYSIFTWPLSFGTCGLNNKRRHLSSFCCCTPARPNGHHPNEQLQY